MSVFWLVLMVSVFGFGFSGFSGRLLFVGVSSFVGFFDGFGW